MSDIQEAKEDVTSESSEQQQQPQKTIEENAMLDQAEKRRAIAAAALARIEKEKKVEEIDKESQEIEKEKLKHEQKMRRLINEIAGSVNYESAFGCLKLLFTLFNNILENPKEEKFRSFRSNQTKIQKEIFSIENSEQLLFETGFRTRINEFQKEWFIPNQKEWQENCLGMKKLFWSKNVIKDKMNEYSQQFERQKDKKEIERNFEKSRKARALAEAQEDRERVALRIQRERKLRLAAEERVAAEKASERQSSELTALSNTEDDQSGMD